MDLNRTTILGRLTRDPEVRTTTTGRTVASVGIATGRVWTDQAGQKQEQTEFHNCVFWGRLADIVGQFLTKGRRVYVEGRLQTRDWVGNDGVKRYRTEIIAENMIMLDAPRNAGAAPGGAPAMAHVSNEAPLPETEGAVEEIKVEDIPF